MDGASLVGALTLTFKPASLTAFAVLGPNVAICVSLCLKSGKFSTKDFIHYRTQAYRSLHPKDPTNLH